MPDRTLEVWCFDELAGVLVDAPDGLTFAYEGTWRDARRPPLSQSLPLAGGDLDSQAVSAFFGGLLPEGQPREVLARTLGVSRDNDFSLLAALGGDTAGAISLLSPGHERVSEGHDVTWLDDAELAEEIRQLPNRPMHVDPDGEYRLSLAGAQDKLPVVVGRDGRVGLTRGGTASTHIMKTPIALLEDTIVNEALCLDLGRRLGIPTVEATPRRAGDSQCLLVARYDRERRAGDAITRLHQEDFCQALGVPSMRKYQAEGGPGLQACFNLIRRASTVPARDAVRLLDYVVLSFLVANHDAHGKNFSLVYRQDGTDVAPAYDVLSTFIYRGALRLSRKMAMGIGGEYRPDYVRPRHFDALLKDAGLGPAPARRRVAALAAQAPDHASAARAALAEAGWDAPILGAIVDLIATRARWLEDMVAAGGPVTSAAVPASGADGLPSPERMSEAGNGVIASMDELREEFDEMMLLAGAAVTDGELNDIELEAAAQRVDASVDAAIAHYRAFAEATWSMIGAIESGRAHGLDVTEVGTPWREVAASSTQVIRALTGFRDLAYELELLPAFLTVAAALDRLVAIGPMIGEWDTRLESLGVLAPKPD